MVCAELSQPLNRGVVTSLGPLCPHPYSLSSVHDVAYDARSILVSIEFMLMCYGPVIDSKGLGCSYNNNNVNRIFAFITYQNGGVHKYLPPSPNNDIQLTANLYT